MVGQMLCKAACFLMFRFSDNLKFSLRMRRNWSKNPGGVVDKAPYFQP